MSGYHAIATVDITYINLIAIILLHACAIPPDTGMFSDIII